MSGKQLDDLADELCAAAAAAAIAKNAPESSLELVSLIFSGVSNFVHAAVNRGLISPGPAWEDNE